MARITRKQAQAAYDAGKPIMSDAEFDAKFGENCGNLGAAGTVNHSVPMLSQQKCHYFADVYDFCEKMHKRGERAFWMSLKMDGIAAAVEYKDGKLFRVSTRGDGNSGDDITAAAKKYINREFLPRNINNIRGHFEVRGEIVVPLSEMGYSPDVNYRNVACGLMMRKDLIESNVKCAFYAYDLIVDSMVLMENNKTEMLAGFGFIVVPGVFVSTPCGMDENIIKIAFDQVKSIRNTFDCCCDGVVIKCDNAFIQNKLGCTKHHPRYSIAYKFPTKSVESVVTEIKIMTGRTGKETPVASIEPVIIDGAKVSSVSIGSIDMMEKRGIKAGCKVIVERSGGVIPRIVEVVK